VAGSDASASTSAFPGRQDLASAAGVPAAQVAEWAGHSVDVLLRVYVKCIAGQQGEAKRRIEDAMRPLEDGKSGGTDREAEPG
jgi:hypothetical protein